MARAEHDADLIQFITELAREENIEEGFLTAVGALKNAKIGFYDQESLEYQEMEVNNPCEIVSCIGNISIKDGEPFVHAHAVLALEDGVAIGGHLLEGQVFASEIHLQEIEGPKIERKHDETTELSLWEFE
ncbi:hypothetical protein AKJ51_01945 [candidate division MSBL1 archaeon SCGC-AAA382A20]|uniref:PPC domain-containing protein n=1 Tax=candidate division MSBL1 archaeon SCGC-AAA382A20 TaxID=1698280 RepID=A0A133VL31_9EURY|nr:hypothetical protein AKJ51_01945 [candidate division MSBL1 archaeon SCGC-AAA382A20]